MLLEHGAYGLKLELVRQVHHREVLVVERAVLLGGIAIAPDQVIEWARAGG